MNCIHLLCISRSFCNGCRERKRESESEQARIREIKNMGKENECKRSISIQRQNDVSAERRTTNTLIPMSAHLAAELLKCNNMRHVCENQNEEYRPNHTHFQRSSRSQSHEMSETLFHVVHMVVSLVECFSVNIECFFTLCISIILFVVQQ